MKMQYVKISELVPRKQIVKLSACVLITLFSYSDYAETDFVFSQGGSYAEHVSLSSPVQINDFTIDLASNIDSDNLDNVSVEVGGNDTDVLNEFISSIITETKPLDADISKFVDDNFWDLV